MEAAVLQSQEQQTLSYMKPRTPINTTNRFYSVSEFFLNRNDGLYRPPPLIFSSSPNLSSITQPPLLPLPFLKSASISPGYQRLSRPMVNSVPVKPKYQDMVARSFKSTTPKLKRNTAPVPSKKTTRNMNAASLDVENSSLIELNMLSDLVFDLSPPPSSLPLPKFTLKPKLKCNAAAGVDCSATDDLRRLLRL